MANTADCVNGHHGDLIAGEPIVLTSCVNVDQVCAICAAVVGVQSYTREAWDARGTA